MAYNSTVVPGYDADLHGDPVWQPSAGVFGGALGLGGADDYVSTPFILDPLKGSFSVFAWIQGESPSAVIVSQTNGSGYGDVWLGTDPASGRLMTSLMFIELCSEAVVTDNQWHKVGVLCDGNRRHLYVDGNIVAEDGGNTGAVAATGGLHIGVGKDPQQQSHCSGLLDDIRIYDRAVEP